MHIKRVTVIGWKSYRDKSGIKECSPGFNVVFGRNGSGKSNFFEAIRFVLSDDYTSVRRKDRHGLLHTGVGTTIMNATVEIVFDNSDSRFTDHPDEVVLRRHIGLKKDEYFLNGTHRSKQEIVNLLESAGFSRANPYYIVQQHKISSLLAMSDAARLQLLKEVAGTRVYDERRAESKKILNDTATKREKIDEVIDGIENRIKDLDAERDELVECQKLDSKRRALEFTIANNQLEVCREKLEVLDLEYQEELAKSNSVKVEIEERNAKLELLERRLKQLEAESAALETSKEQATGKRGDLVRTQTQLSLKQRKLVDALKSDEEKQEELNREMQQLQRSINKTEKKLNNTLRPAFEAKQREADELERAKAEAEQGVSALLAKQGHAQRFATQAERDEYLREEIRQQSDTVAGLEQSVRTLKQQVDKCKKDVAKSDAIIKRKQRQRAENAARAKAAEDERTPLAAKRTSLHDQKNERQRELAQISKKMAELTDAHDKAKRRLDRAKPRALAEGLEEVERYVAQNNIEGVRGTILDLIEVRDARCMTAVEAIAQNQLFHYVVDNDDVAARLMTHLERTKAGRVTFIPLNRLKEKHFKYPEDGSGAVPVISLLSFGKEFKKAMTHVFGMALLCRELEAASKFSREYNMDCVTLDGQMVNSKGALRGGWIDPKGGRLKAATDMNEAYYDRSTLDDEADKLKKVVTTLEQELTGCVQDMQRLGVVISKAHHMERSLAQEICKEEKRKNDKRDKLARMQRRVEAELHNLQAARRELASMEEELASDMSSKLSSAEQERLEKLNHEVAHLQEQYLSKTNEAEAAHNEVNKLERQLCDNLLRRKAEIEQKLAVDDSGGALATREHAHELQSVQAELDLVNHQLAEAQASSEQTDTQLAKLRQATTETTRELDAQRTEHEDLRKKVNDDNNRMEALLGKKKVLLDKREQAMSSVRQLGTRPTDAEQWSGKSSKVLKKALKRCNEELKKFSHVNKKALDQYASFSEQRTNLLTRRNELNDGYGAIHELIKDLDRKKDEAIARTFKGVAMHFKEVIRELVPSGSGNLVMLRDTGYNGAEEKGDDADASASGEGDGSTDVSSFQGVAIEVMFPDKGNTQRMEKLSGGEKAVVALALIFAIQRCDPAPFYVFDEVDVALDPAYRASVADLIQRQGNAGTQFIVASHKTEMVERADRLFGVSMQHKVSRVHPLTRDDALEYAQAMAEEAAEAPRKRRRTPAATTHRGAAQSVPGSSPARAGGAGGGAGAGAGTDDDSDEDMGHSSDDGDSRQSG